MPPSWKSWPPIRSREDNHRHEKGGRFFTSPRNIITLLLRLRNRKAPPCLTVAGFFSTHEQYISYSVPIYAHRLKSTLNLTRTQATGANIHTLDLTLNHSADTLNVGLPGALRLQMRMADIVAGQLTLCTNLANTCHIATPPYLCVENREWYGFQT